MSNHELHDENKHLAGNSNGADHQADYTSDSLSEIFDSIDASEYEFEDDEDAYYHKRTRLAAVDHSLHEPEDASSQDAQAPADVPSVDSDTTDDTPMDLGAYTDYDAYNDSGTYRSYDGSSEYRSFDAAMPEAPENGWYHYSQEDSDLEEHDDYDAEEEDPPEPAPHSHRLLHILSNLLLVMVTLLSAFYLMVLYAPIPALTNLRDMYVRTAMTTINHKWLATAIVPGDIIDQIVLEDYQADLAMTGVKSDWGNVSVQELPTFAEDSTVKEPTDQQSQSAMEQGSQIDSVHTEDDSPYSSTEEEIFFQLFYEIDYNSMQDYLNDHPDALSDGWGAININEAGLDESGTSIQTIHGDQVLALDASNGVLLVRLNLGSSRGIMAICKDTSRLSLRAASTLPATGQTAGNICDANNGILAITGSAFLDDGTSNGGQISGLAVCNGVEMGSRLGGYGDKRLELRNDNRMYIVDSASAVDSDTRDACEFRPALIVDGENVAGNSTWNSPNPRAVLGQSAKLETMMVVVEGRLLDSPGCGVEDIADKLEEYGCVQALNLDGGTSAIMYYKGEYITRCSNTALPGGRTLPSAWVYERAS